MKKVFIIAEAGVNHNGNIELAYKLIDAAKEAGADAIKFQTFKTEKIVAKKAAMADYQKQNLGASISQFEMLKQLELSYDEFKAIKQYCDKRNILFLSTPDEEESLDFLTEELKVPIIKVGSGEIDNFPFLERIAQKNLPVILSTGMANLTEVSEAVELIKRNQKCKNNYYPALSLLHCTTNYPCPFNEVNLRAINTLKDVFQVPVGYSDHTLGIEISVAAVALGATIIEKHFTLDKSLPGPDHVASLEPIELKNMVNSIRNIEFALGNGVKEPSRSEKKMIQVVRKTLIATNDFEEGHVLSRRDIAIKRAGTGISPKYLNVITAMKLTKKVRNEEPFEWEAFKSDN